MYGPQIAMGLTKQRGDDYVEGKEHEVSVLKSHLVVDPASVLLPLFESLHSVEKV